MPTTTTTTWDPESYVTVTAVPRHSTAMQVNARTGRMIQQTRLKSYVTDLEAARAEAQAMYPDRRVVVLALGERAW